MGIPNGPELDQFISALKSPCQRRGTLSPLSPSLSNLKYATEDMDMEFEAIETAAIYNIGLA